MALSPEEELELLELEEAEYQHQKVKTPKIPDVSMGESVVRGATQGATMGFADELGGLAQQGMDKVYGLFGDSVTDVNKKLADQGFTGDIGPKDSSSLYTQARNENRIADTQAQEANPLTYGGANVAGNIATGLAMPFANAAKGASVLNAASKGAAMGGLQGFGYTNELDKNALLDIGKGAAIGGSLSGLGQGIGNKLQKVNSSKLSEDMKKFAEMQAAKAQGLERSTRKILGEEGSRAIGRQGLDSGGVNLLNSADDMMAANERVMTGAQNTRQNVYDLIDNQDMSEFSPKNVSSKIDDTLGDFDKYSPLNREKTSRLSDTLEGIERKGFDESQNMRIKEIKNLLDKGFISDKNAKKLTNELLDLQMGAKNLSMNDAQKLMKELEESTNYTTLNPSTADKLSNKAYRYARQELNDSAGAAAYKLEHKVAQIQAKMNNPKIGQEEAQELMNELMQIEMQANQIPGGISNLKQTVEDANKKMSIGLDTKEILANKFAREANKSIGLSDTITIAQNPVLYPAKKAWERYGNQSVAVGFDKLGDMVKNSPQAFGKFGGVLQNAAQRGSQALGATHFLLQQQNPEYQQLMKNIRDNE